MDTFRAVADPVRRSLVERLARRGATTAGELADAAREEFGISQPATSKHLKALLDAGLVTRSAVAQRRLYRLEPAAFDELAAWAARQSRFWNEKLDALEDHLQAGPPAGRDPSVPRSDQEVDP